MVASQIESDPERIWLEHVKKLLEQLETASNDVVSKAHKDGTIEGADAARQLRTWLHGTIRVHLEHLRTPDANTLTSLMKANPRWQEHTRTEEMLATIAEHRSMPAEDIISRCENALRGASDQEYAWWRIALKLVEDSRTVGSIIDRAARTGQGPPGAHIVRHIHNLGSAAPTDDDRTTLSQAKAAAQQLPRHWRLILLAGPETLRWLALIQDEERSATLVSGEDTVTTREEAETLVTERLTASLLARPVSATRRANTWIVELQPLPDDLPGELPIYIVRSRRGTVHRLQKNALMPASDSTSGPLRGR